MSVKTLQEQHFGTFLSLSPMTVCNLQQFYIMASIYTKPMIQNKTFLIASGLLAYLEKPFT